MATCPTWARSVTGSSWSRSRLAGSTRPARSQRPMRSAGRSSRWTTCWRWTSTPSSTCCPARRTSPPRGGSSNPDAISSPRSPSPARSPRPTSCSTWRIAVACMSWRHPPTCSRPSGPGRGTSSPTARSARSPLRGCSRRTPVPPRSHGRSTRRSSTRRASAALLDLAVYGLTQVTGVLGPARRVSALSGITVPERRVRGGPFDGMTIPVSAPDNNLILVDFGDATFAVVDGTFNVVASRSPRMEVFGLEGTLLVNRDDVGAPPVEVYRLEAAPGLAGWINPRTYEIFPVGSDRFAELARGVLIEHLADCIRDGVQPIASGRHARHVLWSSCWLRSSRPWKAGSSTWSRPSRHHAGPVSRRPRSGGGWPLWYGCDRRWPPDPPAC